MPPSKINHAAVWVVAVLHQLLGALWYSPLLFAEKWMSLINAKEADFANPNPLPFIISFAGAVTLCYTMAWLFTRLNVKTAGRGLQFAVAFWVAFLFFEMLTYNAFELRPYALAFINAGKSLVAFMLAGIILGAWVKRRATIPASRQYANA